MSRSPDMCDIGAFQTAASALTLTKTAPASVTAGNPYDYTLTAGSTGPGPSTNTTVTDQLPAGMTLYGATPSQGTCSSTGSPVLVSCDRLGDHPDHPGIQHDHADHPNPADRAARPDDRGSDSAQRRNGIGYSCQRGATRAPRAPAHRLFLPVRKK